jgi:hypothetical protein
MNDLRPKDGLVDIPIKVIKKINGKMFKHPRQRKLFLLFHLSQVLWGYINGI